MTKDESQALKDFLIDIDCLKKLDNWTDDYNLFEVLGITNTEIRHSNILAWLFKPYENHGLGDRFIKGFFTKLVDKYNDIDSDAFELLLQNFDSYQVTRETNHMDIVLNSNDEKTVVIIENKIWANESSNQLKEYYEKSKKEYRNYKHYIYVYLTPDGRRAKKESDDAIWKPFSYEEIVELIENAIDDANIRSESRLLIENYIKIVKEKIMDERDEELVKVCNEIYAKHSTALKLIFDNVKMDNSLDNEIICSTLKEIADSGKILYPNENDKVFFTKEMDKYLPKLKEDNSSWGTNWVYYFWFSGNEERLKIHFELGGRNVNEKTMEKMKKIIEASDKNTRSNFKYFRTFLSVEKLNSEKYEESLKKAVQVLVDRALDYQEEILKKIGA